MKKRPEILAPAGSYESLTAAVNAGADAVYIGGSQFGARAYANNLSEEQLLSAIDYVHLNHRKLYMTINTLFKEEELNRELYDYLLPYYRQGLDAVIVQDIGVLSYIRQRFPDLPIHASTQMTVTGVDEALLLKELGVSRIVTARELSFPEIVRIKEATGLEVECFVHGALCYCYSGQCLMSSMIGGRSGNRGRCAQPCRLPYELYHGSKKLSSNGNKYLLSPKDLNSLALIPSIAEAGIDSMKIEGRMKKPEYVAKVVQIYRRYLDQYLDHPEEPYRVKEEDSLALMELYNRGGFTEGYYQQHNGPQMMSMERPNHRGILLGQIAGIDGNLVRFRPKQDVHIGDVLEIAIGSEENVELTSPLDCPKGANLSLKAKNLRSLKTGMSIYRTRNQTLLNQIREELIEAKAKESIHAHMILRKGRPMELTITWKDMEVTCTGKSAEPAQKQPVTEAQVENQLRKTGTTGYQFDAIVLEMEQNLFIPVQAVKEIRRLAIARLEEQILEAYRRPQSLTESSSPLTLHSPAWNPAVSGLRSETRAAIDACETTISIPELSVYVCHEDHFQLVLEEPEITAIYSDLTGMNLKDMGTFTDRAIKAGKKLYYVLPRIFRVEARLELDQRFVDLLHDPCDGFVIRSMEELSYLLHHPLVHKEGFHKELVLDSYVYQYNQESIEFYDSLLADIPVISTLPLELNHRELLQLNYPGSEFLVYGYLPLMVSAQCLLKNTTGCIGHEQITELSDRLGNRFPVLNHCKYCYNTIYNSKPLLLFDLHKEIATLNPKRLRMDLTIESEEEAKALLHQFVQSVRHPENSMDQQILWKHTGYTRGHFKRGIE